MRLGVKTMFDKKISEVMTSPAECLAPNASVRDAAIKMRENDIGTIVVCESADKPVGIVTDRDIAVRCAAAGGEPGSCEVSKIMSRDIVTIGQDKTIRDAEKLMEERQLRRLVVVDGSGRLCGVVALSDIVGEDRNMTGRIVEKVSQPAASLGH
jgi:CBS domain-containing protein